MASLVTGSTRTGLRQLASHIASTSSHRLAVSASATVPPCTCRHNSASPSKLIAHPPGGSHVRWQSASAAAVSSSHTNSDVLPAISSTSAPNYQIPTTATSTSGQAISSIKPPKSLNGLDTSSALALLRSQPSHYVVASVYQRRFLLTPRDLVTIPRLKDVNVGDVIRLDRIHELGSRDYTLQASDGQVLGDNCVQVSATVVEHTKGKLEKIVKFKKRKGYTKTIEHKAKYTRLRVGDIFISDQQDRPDLA